VTINVCEGSMIAGSGASRNSEEFKLYISLLPKHGPRMMEARSFRVLPVSMSCTSPQ
jgi:hypothetical protein